MEALLNKIESYGFVCEAGPLALCQDWMKLRMHIAIAAHDAAAQQERPVIVNPLTGDTRFEPESDPPMIETLYNAYDDVTRK